MISQLARLPQRDHTLRLAVEHHGAKDHPFGVWTLPPTYRLKDQDRDKYRAIGESDRFTLKFEKR